LHRHHRPDLWRRTGSPGKTARLKNRTSIPSLPASATIAGPAHRRCACRARARSRPVPTGLPDPLHPHRRAVAHGLPDRPAPAPTATATDHRKQPV